VSEAVLTHLVGRLEEVGATRVPIPRAEFMRSAGVGKTAITNACRRLLDLGLIVCVERGHPAGPRTRTRRAHVWALPASVPGPAA
jgi:hypothetical protein